MKIIYLKYIGTDDWDRHCYQDINNRFSNDNMILKDTDVFTKPGVFSNLCTSCQEGEPEYPIDVTNYTFIMVSEEQNKEIADKIANVIIEHGYGHDTNIYFNGMCYELKDNTINAVPDRLASKCFEYANDATVSLSFEGPLYNAINGFNGHNMYTPINKIAEDYGYYFELGNAWNMSMYK